MTLTYADAEANTVGVCPHCHGHPHTDTCLVPHIGWADGTERCDQCRNGLDAGEGYLPAAVERVGWSDVAVGLVCLPCGLIDQ